MFLSEDSSKLQAFLNRLNGSLAMSGVCFTPSKWKVLLGN